MNEWWIVNYKHRLEMGRERSHPYPTTVPNAILNLVLPVQDPAMDAVTLHNMKPNMSLSRRRAVAAGPGLDPVHLSHRSRISADTDVAGSKASESFPPSLPRLQGG